MNVLDGVFVIGWKGVEVIEAVEVDVALAVNVGIGDEVSVMIFGVSVIVTNGI